MTARIDALIERAFCADLDAIRKDPDQRLWGDRIVVESGMRSGTSGRVDEASRSRRNNGHRFVRGAPCCCASPRAKAKLLRAGLPRWLRSVATAKPYLSPESPLTLAKARYRPSSTAYSSSTLICSCGSTTSATSPLRNSVRLQPAVLRSTIVIRLASYATIITARSDDICL